MKQKRWMIPLLILFIGIIVPLKTHAAELKDTDESVVKWRANTEEAKPEDLFSGVRTCITIRRI